MGGCAFTANGEATILSLIRTTPENDVLALLAHLQADLNGKPLLQTLIDKVDLGALVAAITYVEKSSTNAVNAYAFLDENDPNLASKVNERIIPVYDNDLYTKDFEGKIRYNATYQNGVVKVERQVYGCTLTEKSDGAGDYVWVPDCKFTLEASYSLSPYDMVSINNLSRLSAIENDLDISTNGVADLPALALVYISQEQTSNKTWQAINLAGTVVGSGGALIAYRAGKLAIATLEAATALGSMGQDGINMGLIPAEYQNEIANYNLIAGGLGLTAGATALPKLGTLAVQQVRSGFSSAISRVSAQRFLDAFERLKSNTAQWATLRTTAQGRAVQQKLTNLAKYLTSKGMKAGQAVESGLLAASAVKRWGQKTATGLVLLTNMFVVDPAVLARGGDMVEAVTKVEAKVGFKANGVVLKNDIPTSFSPISVRGATPLENPTPLQNIDFERADDILPDGTVQNSVLQQGPRQVTMQQASVGDYLLLQLGVAGLGTVYLAQKNPTSDDCSICKGIIINGQNRNEICKSLEALAAKAGLSYKTIIENKLCKSNLSNLRLAEVATKLTSYSTTDIQAFLGDISVSSCGGNTYICGNINNLTVGLIEAWKIENEAVITSTRKLNRDWKTLNTIRDIQTNEATTLQSLLSVSGLSGGLKTILQAYSVADCPTCGNHATYGIPDLAEVWVNAKYMLNLHNQNVLGARNLITGSSLFHPANSGFGFGAKSGANHMIKDIRSRMWGATNIAAIDQGLPNSTKRFDLQRSNGEGYIEYKSYSEDYGIGDVTGIGSGSWKDFEQFLAYLKQPQVQDMGGITFEYVFDAKKIPNTNQEIQKAFQKMMCTNCEAGNTATPKTLTAQGTQVFETIWANTALRGNLFPDNNTEAEKADAINDFKTLLSNMENSFFKFIKVR